MGTGGSVSMTSCDLAVTQKPSSTNLVTALKFPSLLGIPKPFSDTLQDNGSMVSVAVARRIAGDDRNHGSVVVQEVERDSCVER